MNRQQELERAVSGALQVARRAQEEADTTQDAETKQAMQRLADSERENAAQNQERLNAFLQQRQYQPNAEIK